MVCGGMRRNTQSISTSNMQLRDVCNKLHHMLRRIHDSVGQSCITSNTADRSTPPLPEPHTGADAHFMEDLASG
jgi:hypothetical protein